MVTKKQISDIANVLRRDVAIITNYAGSGHLTSCLSCAEIMACLFFSEMKWDTKNPQNPGNDEFILSKGHAAPILYSALFRAKAINYDLKSLRKLNSPLEGHPSSRHLPWIKVSTGSLGQGLSIGIGMALAAKLKNQKFRTFVLMGDSEISEGSIWEAFQLAPYYKLNNLCAIIDINRLGQTRETMLGYSLKIYKKRIKDFGWKTIIINGHNISQILKALSKSRKTKRPLAIIAKTIKGKGISFLENKEGWHGKTLDDRQLNQALDELPKNHMPHINIDKPKKTFEKKQKNNQFKFTNYPLNTLVATREAYGNALANLTLSNPKIISLDAEVSNSTMSEKVKEKNPSKFIEVFIAEQNMISIALGLSAKGLKPFASTFSAFLSRAHDQIRMAEISNANITICGSHAGVSVGEDGASQMGLEDISLFRSLPNSYVFYPSDATSTEKLTFLSSKLKNIKYIRTTRPKTPVLYNPKEKFVIGDFKILKESRKDKAVLVGAGITLQECLKAYEYLEKKSINLSVIDLYCIKPFNSKKFINFVKKHGNKLIIVEDHYKEGGIGEMLGEELENTNIKIAHLYIKEVPRSGKMEQLLKKYRIDSTAIIEVFKKLN
ncbi:MAG: transketolase [Candidatus Pacearchaeota archaeon]